MNRRDAITFLAGLGMAIPWIRARAAGGDVRGYGMRPDAAPAANAAALQRCLNENAGSQVTIPGADADYQLSGTIRAPAGTSITLGDGARLRWVATPEPSGTAYLRTPARPAIEVIGDSFHLTGKGQLIGPSKGKYVEREIGILCIGKGTGGMHRGFEITEGVEIRGWGSHGIAVQFAQDVRVLRTKVIGCGYAGMQFLSCRSGTIGGNIVGEIGPGVDANAYGISCSHDSHNYDADPHARDNGRLAANPFSTGFEVAGNIVYDNPIWTGVDFHGAYDCRASNNKVYNCRNGVLLQGSSGMAIDYAGENNSVISNTVTASRMNGEPTTIATVQRLGISVNGGKVVRHRSIVVHDNTIDGYGDSKDTSFSLQHSNTSNVEISNNRVTNWRGYGCYSMNSQGTISGNDFGPVADRTSAACIFVAVGGELRIVNNRHVVPPGKGALYGVYINTPTDPPYVIQGNDFSSATTQQYAGHLGARLSPAQIVGGHP